MAGKQLYFVKQLFIDFPGLTKLAESLLVCAVLFHKFQGAQLPMACEGIVSQSVKACNPIRASQINTPSSQGH